MATAETSNVLGQDSPKLDWASPDFDIAEVQGRLKEHGVVIIRNVIPVEDCNTYIREIKEWLDQFEDFPSNVGSIIHKYNIAHIEPAWKVRLQVKPVFAAVWQTEKLLSSTDGIAVGKPPENGGVDFGNPVPRDGLHYDQGPKKQGLHAYQGAVYLEEALEDDWCFAVMTKSNHFHQEFFTHFRGAGGRSEFKKLNDKQFEWLKQQGCELIRVPVQKGGIVLWDSRTVHAGAPPKFGRRNIGRWRYIVFVSQTPAIWASKEDLECKKVAYEQLKCSRHWSSMGASNFRTGTSVHDIKELPDIAKTDACKLLAGVQSYDFGDGQSNGPKMKPKIST